MRIFIPRHRLSIFIALIAIFIALVGLPLGGSAAAPVAAKGKPNDLGGCPMFPTDSIFNRDISTLSGNPNSPYLTSIGLNTGLHADFGSGTWNGGPIGIPYTTVPQNQPFVPISFYYDDQSDPGPYPIPANAPIEYGSDHHILLVQQGICELYEVYDASYNGSSWDAGSGAKWNLTSNALRPSGWTSADAAGLPMLPLLVRYDEVAAGVINHPIRFTADNTQNTFIWPARHQASSITDPGVPPMGVYVRLKSSVDISTYPPQSRVILTAMKKYGMIVADNGSNWFVSGAPDERWDNDDLQSLGNIKGHDFEVVDVSSLMIDPNSGQARQVIVPTPTACPGHFRDVCPSYWAYTYIEAMATQGIMSGYPGGYFLPNNNVNRAEFAKILTLAEGWPLTTPATQSFSDVPPTHWAYAFVETVHAHGAINGYPDGSYKPNNLITRAEMAKMVAVADSVPAYTPTSGSTFADAPRTYWAFSFIEAVNHAGFMTGIGGGNFGVSGRAKRSETARIVYLMMQ